MRIWVNGAFDILHIGHIRLLKHAATLGRLKVAIDTDARIKELKGHNRPFNCFDIRREFLLSLRFVNDVIGFNTEEELVNEIKLYKPDIMVIGSDYKNKKIVGSEFINKIVYFDRVENMSTTSILEYEKDSSNR